MTTGNAIDFGDLTTVEVRQQVHQMVTEGYNVRI